MYACARVLRVYASAMLSRTCVEKKAVRRAGGRARARGRRYFFTRMRGEGDSGGKRGGDGRGWRGGGPPFAVDFSGLFFTGDGPRLPG